MSEKVNEDQERTNQTKKALHDAITAANLVLDGVLAEADVGTSGRSGGSNMGKKRRMKEHGEEKRQSESASVHYPSSRTAPSEKLRLDDDKVYMPRQLCKVIVMKYYHSLVISGVAKTIFTMVQIFNHSPWHNE